MTNKRYALFKRVYEYYQADPEYRKCMDKDPVGTVRALDLPGGDGEIIREAVEAIITGNTKACSDNPYLEMYYQRIRSVIDRSTEMVAGKRYISIQALSCVERNLNRSRMESAVFRRHTQIRYIPLAFELSKGCRVHCSFCGLNAGFWEEDFSYKKERELWISILKKSCGIIGEITDQAPLYFATEPLDHPDYEAFLRDEDELFSHIPQTTTAVPERDVTRTKKLMAFLGSGRLEDEGRLRFSIRSLPQFKRVMVAFSPDELSGVELLMNNPESKNAISLSGRTLQYNGAGERLGIAYSISCLSGVKVNLCDKSMSFIEPVKPDAAHQEGVNVRETVSFENAGDYAEKLYKLFEKYGGYSPGENDILSLNCNVKLIKKDNNLILAGEGAGYSIKRNLFTEKLIRLLSDHNNGVKYSEITSGLVKQRKDKDSLYNLIDLLYQKGYIVVL